MNKKQSMSIKIIAYLLLLAVCIPIIVFVYPKIDSCHGLKSLFSGLTFVFTSVAAMICLLQIIDNLAGLYYYKRNQ